MTKKEIYLLAYELTVDELEKCKKLDDIDEQSIENLNEAANYLLNEHNNTGE